MDCPWKGNTAGEEAAWRGRCFHKLKFINRPFFFDLENGRLLNAKFSGYKVPTKKAMVAIDSDVITDLFDVRINLDTNMINNRD